MDDTQLNSLRGEPSPAFTARLQQSLREHDASTSRIEWPGVRSIAAPVLIVLAIVGAMAADGKLDPHVEDIRPFDEAAEALAAVETGHARGKVVIQVS